MPDEASTDQSTAEPSAPTAAPSAAPAAPSPSPRRELASIADALRQTSARSSDRPSSRGSGRPDDHDSGAPGDSASASTPRGPSRSTGPSPDRASSAAAGDSAPDGASTPDDDTDDDDSQPAPAARPSRRERAEARDLRAERDALAAERDALRQATTVPREVYDAAIASRLPDEEFQRLAIKKQREDLTGDYLTAAEAEKLGRAIQVREWSLPWYLDAQKQVQSWSQAEWDGIQRRQADAIARVMKQREYLKPDPVARAGDWSHILDYFCDASFEAGKASLAEDLAEAKARIADLEAEGRGLRVGARSRPLERGGVSGGRGLPMPDYATATAAQLFEAGFAREEQQRQRRRRAG